MKDMTDKQAYEIIEQCLDEMYRNSEPSNTWASIKKFFGGTEMTFHDKHTMSEDSYDKIKNKYYAKLSKYYKRQLDWFLLAYSPTIKEDK
jgi:hypothetical protein